MGAPAGRESRDGKTLGHDSYIGIRVVLPMRIGRSRCQDSTEQCREVRFEVITSPAVARDGDRYRAKLLCDHIAVRIVRPSVSSFKVIQGQRLRSH